MTTGDAYITTGSGAGFRYHTPEHQPHPGTTRPAWAVASPEYLAKHSACNHAWGTCTIYTVLCYRCYQPLLHADGADRCLNVLCREFDKPTTLRHGAN